MLFKKGISLLAAALALTLAIFEGAYPFNYYTSPPRRWSVSSVDYYINLEGAPEGAEEAIKNAFQTWQNVGGCYISFNYRGLTDAKPETKGTQQGGTPDGKSVVGWVQMGSDTLGVTSHFYGNTGGSPYELNEVDIALNANKPWSTTGDTNAYDVKSVVLHEVGHLLGLDHSSDTDAVMYGYIGEGELKRSLTQDDIDGAIYLLTFRNTV